jgi:hypothetical protein
LKATSAGNPWTEEAAEKLLLVVILSEAKDLLFRKREKKADSSG